MYVVDEPVLFFGVKSLDGWRKKQKVAVANCFLISRVEKREKLTITSCALLIFIPSRFFYAVSSDPSEKSDNTTMLLL